MANIHQYQVHDENVHAKKIIDEEMHDRDPTDVNDNSDNYLHDPGASLDIVEIDDYLHDPGAPLDIVETDATDINHVDPFIGQEFSTHEDARMFYNDYAKRKGFGTRISSTNRSRQGIVVSRKYVCEKEGYKDLHDKREEGRHVVRKRDTRTGCMAKMLINSTQSGSWVVKVFDDNHNHPFFTPSKVKKLRSHNKYHRSNSCRNLIEDLHDQGLRPSTMARVINVLKGSQEEDITAKQCVDNVKLKRKNNIGRECVAIIKYFEAKKDLDPSFYFAMELSDDQTLRSVFWADGRSIASYLQFSDVVCFDVTYKTNKFSLPFAPFTGVNHHRQSTLFGCALLADESEETFIWLFEKWLKCMCDKAPGAIITDQDPAMRNAIRRVFPNTRHRFCSWHISLHALERTQDLRSRHVEFWDDYNQWIKSSSGEKFEDRWEEMKEKYQIDRKHWLSRMYELRENWIPAYLNSTFFAGMTSSQRSESINAFFDGFVHCNTPLHEFVQQYDNAVVSRRKSENSEDYMTMNSRAKLSTTLALEKQAGEHYTRKIFELFQKQFIGSLSCWHKKVRKECLISTYIVGPSTDDEKKWKTVVYDVSDGVSASCECSMFETEGILCMHILRIMHLKQLATIPERYMLKRWTMSVRHQVGNIEGRASTSAENNSKVTPLMMWDIKVKMGKMLEATSNSLESYEEFTTLLDAGLAKAEMRKKNTPISSNEQMLEPNDTQAKTVKHTVEITVRDPVGPIKHKGRPSKATRQKSSLEVSIDDKNKRTCGYCKVKGHYRTGCHKAKEDLKASSLNSQQGAPCL